MNRDDAFLLHLEQVNAKGSSIQRFNSAAEEKSKPASLGAISLTRSQSAPHPGFNEYNDGIERSMHEHVARKRNSAPGRMLAFMGDLMPDTPISPTNALANTSPENVGHGEELEPEWRLQHVPGPGIEIGRKTEAWLSMQFKHRDDPNNVQIKNYPDAVVWNNEDSVDALLDWRSAQRILYSGSKKVPYPKRNQGVSVVTNVDRRIPDNRLSAAELARRYAAERAMRRGKSADTEERKLIWPTSHWRRKVDKTLASWDSLTGEEDEIEGDDH